MSLFIRKLIEERDSSETIILGASCINTAGSSRERIFPSDYALLRSKTNIAIFFLH